MTSHFVSDIRVKSICSYSEMIIYSSSCISILGGEKETFNFKTAFMYNKKLYESLFMQMIGFTGNNISLHKTQTYTDRGEMAMICNDQPCNDQHFRLLGHSGPRLILIY
ncbi:hypothetical protein CHS0354_003212 [Potamilus streckersoni]|uniref:Uncharacterized protein n=1 Tax=Potamilus streckersoni TaxID=2493646 RepID=A0AAE0SIW2_9BIVA|nr:hypothetical protein CHS0354_003212 [Potamilus streckersoni]